MLIIKGLIRGKQEGGGGQMTVQYFFYLIIFVLATVLERADKKIGVRVGERGGCILRTDSNQTSPSF